MPKQFWAGSALLAPVPPAMVSCGTLDQPNILTIAWTGMLCTHPALTYISVRPTRYSYALIREQGCFAINLTTSALVQAADFCGVRSGAQVDKFAACGLHPVAAEKISAPIIEECPVSLECHVTEIKPLGTHDMFFAEIIGVDVEERYIDSKGKLNLQQCGLTAYAHGEYFSLGRKLGDFGYSVRKKKTKTK